MTTAGDIHFDREENWDCTDDGTTFDIGIVATHEIGHAIGLGHETTDTALMNPFYNPVVGMPLVDYIEGIESIYGPSSVTCSISTNASFYSGSELVNIATMTIANTTGVFVETEWKTFLVTAAGLEFNFGTLGADGSFFVPPGYFLDAAEPDIPAFYADTQPHGTWAAGCRVENASTGKDFDAFIYMFETTP